MYETLKQYGWNEDLEIQFQAISIEQPLLIPGRVTSVHRISYDVITESGEMVCEITGNRLKDKNPYQKPIVGDWVLIERGEANNGNIIREILLRKTILKRKKIGGQDNVQIIASNVDRAVIVQSLAQDFSVRRLERNLLQLADTGIKPIIVLNKLDLVEDTNEFEKVMRGIDENIPVIYSSFVSGHGLDEIQNMLTPGETVVFIGSSGVGKSSIINTMLDEERQQKTRAISTYSGKGKHTTTSRKLFLLENGVIVIDTPGTREFGLVLDDESVLQEQFAQIDQFSRHCKFRDCRHDTEPDCAVKDAIIKGELSESILDAWQKLSKEVNQKS